MYLKRIILVPSLCPRKMYLYTTCNICYHPHRSVAVTAVLPPPRVFIKRVTSAFGRGGRSLLHVSPQKHFSAQIFPLTRVIRQPVNSKEPYRCARASLTWSHRNNCFSRLRPCKRFPDKRNISSKVTRFFGQFSVTHSVQ